MIIGNNPTQIDNLATDGLSGTENSLAYRVEEIEKHLHNRERWFGAAAVASGETHVADEMDGAIVAFQLVAGASDFGSWVQILGSADTPVVAGMVKFDAHRYLVTDTNSTNPFIIQLIAGESADFAANLAAGNYTSTPYVSATNNNDAGIEEVMSIRVPVTAKVWARCACVGATGTTLDLYFGIHEYIG